MNALHHGYTIIDSPHGTVIRDTHGRPWHHFNSVIDHAIAVDVITAYKAGYRDGKEDGSEEKMREIGRVLGYMK